MRRGRTLAALLRTLADRLALLADACHRAAERIAPSVTPASDYVEPVAALRVERWAELEAEAARQQERVSHGFRVIPGGVR